MSTDEQTCCPRFDPAPRDGKRFMQDRVTSPFHIPLNYGAVMTRMQAVFLLHHLPKCARKYGKNYLVLLAQTD